MVYTKVNYVSIKPMILVLHKCIFHGTISSIWKCYTRISIMIFASYIVVLACDYRLLHVFINDKRNRYNI